jgi:hypothetical protein
VVAVSLLDLFEFGPTPVAILLVAVGLTLVAALAILLLTQLGAKWADRKWPPNQALNPTELLWAESGSHVQRTFKGLDPSLGKEVATQLEERKLKAGSFLFHQGDVATHFYIVSKGKIEALEEAPERVLRSYAPGESFGEVAILGRTARTASVRAVADSVVLGLPAEDFVAAAALSAADGQDFGTVVAGYLAADEARRAEAPRPAPVVPEPQPAPPPVTPEHPAWQATHLVPAGGLGLWEDAARAGAPAATLPARTEVMVGEVVGPSARVTLADGASGWVDRRPLIRHRQPRDQ